MNDHYQPLNLMKWIEENKHLLKPPVSNKVIWKDREFIIMVVGGPNERTDFHVNQDAEFFYQLEGKLTLKIMNPEGKMKDIILNGGDIYLLPARTPHSPQREAHSIGLVVETHRRENELDGLQWFCEQCETKLYEEFFTLTSVETQFPPVFERYYNSTHTTCSKCNHVNGRKWTHVKN
jgi:3-hydroxyanthranilate 3,4-dioxygenase